MSYSILNKINSPKDLREKVASSELKELCTELREFVIDIVSEKGGHFGASLGVVELTVALHYVFNTPEDLLVWDVGHQAYIHKILTGRKKDFHTIRKKNGISGFPKRSESNYDTFGVGHSSTSISAILGMAVAARERNITRQHIAVIGDGAMTAGLAFEGLNHGGVEKTNMLIILNDNCMSIDPNVGALKDYLTRITTSETYNKIKKDIWETLESSGHIGSIPKVIIQKIENGVKSMILKQSNLFESLNFRYFGPVDGHDVVKLSKVLEDLKKIDGPKILHCITKKGKGYIHSEKGDETVWHAPGKFNKNTGELLSLLSKTPNLSKFQDVFGESIIELAKKNNTIVGVTPAMPTGCSLNKMLKLMPERVFDVGIAEQHAVTFSAGMASQGLTPFCNIYSSFMQRAYDSVIHDVCIQNLNVVFCLDRGGLVGDDGETHQGVFDIAYLKCIPNIIISVPKDELELRNLMYTSQVKPQGPFSIRYPRGSGTISDWKKDFKELPIGKGEKLKDGKHIAIISVGTVFKYAQEAIKEIEEKFNSIAIAHYDLRFVKPLDETMLHEIYNKYKYVITVEDGCLKGGAGSSILEFASDKEYLDVTVKRLGVPDEFIAHASQEQQHEYCYFNKDAIKHQLDKFIAKLNTNTKAM